MTDKKITSQDMEAAFAAATMQDNRCPVGRLYDSVDEATRRVLEAKVEDTAHISAAIIVRVLKGLGFPPISTETVTRHRKGACRCR